MKKTTPIIIPNCPFPKKVKAYATTRIGGVSMSPFNSFNLAMHVTDDPLSVEQNRTHLIKQLNMPNEPFWLEQTHSHICLDIAKAQNNFADASYSNAANKICVVLTADCLPVLFCSKNGDEVAAAHAGWRGLCNGILEQTVKYFNCPKDDIIAWFGPAISVKAFEVGIDVKDQFVAVDKNAELAFTPVLNSPQKFMADIYLLAKQRLQNLGINHIYGGDYCTYTQNELFYSYRKEGKTGRIASMIWFED